MKNPFNPSFGRQPTVLLDRTKLLNQLVSDIKDLDTPYRTTLIYGARGIGKTVFMNEVGRQIDQDPDWIVVHLIIGERMVARLTEMLYQQTTGKLKKLFNQISGIEVNVGGVGFKFNVTEEATANYQYLLNQMLTIMREHHQYVLVMIDEAQDVPEMVELVLVYQVMISQDLPISMIMTGLPKNIQELQNNHVLTFLLRSGRVNLSPLDFYDVRAQYQKKFQKRDPQINPTVIRRAAQLADGYAYAFQLLGYLIWQSPDERITNQTIDDVFPEYQAQLSRNSYSKMLEELSPVDQQMVLAIAKAPEYPVSTTYLGKKMNKPSGYIGMYRRRLIDSQVIRAAGYGKVKFALPLFREFVLDDGQCLVMG